MDVALAIEIGNDNDAFLIVIVIEKPSVTVSGGQECLMGRKFPPETG